MNPFILLRPQFKRIQTLLILAPVFLFTQRGLAHPVAFKGATSVMTWNQSFLSDFWVAHSFHPKNAIASRLMRMNMRDGRADYLGVQFDHLLKRWNGLNHQANIYLYGGIGNLRWQNQNDLGYLAGVEADIEDRRYFALVKLESMRSRIGDDFDLLQARVGIAPYEAEYNEIATWLMLQAQWHPSLVKKLVITPMFRMFYKSFLFENGVSLDGDWMANFMFHF